MIAAITFFAAVVASPSVPFREPVRDAELARMRGGMRLPNGLDVSIGVDIQTRIDGVLALHTIYSSDGPTPGYASIPTGEGVSRSHRAPRR